MQGGKKLKDGIITDGETLKSLISQYETHGTMEDATLLIQYLLDTDLIHVTIPQIQKYVPLANYLLLEGLCYDVGYII